MFILKSFFQTAAAVALLVAFISVSIGANAGSAAPYKNLLDNCANEIQAVYADSKMTVLKKVNASSSYKFWISVTPVDGQPAKAYCEGKVRGGKIKEFAIADGNWRERQYVTDAKLLLQEYVAKD